METRANYVIVGIFTIAAVLAAFAFVYWTAAIGDRGETVLLRFRIPGSASGLTRGSAVLFNGVRVGDVQRVYIDVTNPSAAIADAQVDRLTPVTKSTQGGDRPGRPDRHRQYRNEWQQSRTSQTSFPRLRRRAG